MDADRRVATIARGQHGLVTYEQAREAGWPRATLQRRLDEGRLEAVHDAVYRLAGAPVSWAQRVLAAVLNAGRGALASHRTALLLWGLGDVEPVVEITVPRGRRPVPAGVIVHRSGDVHRALPSSRQGVPVTSPLRTAADIGAVAPWLVATVVEQGLTLGLFTVLALEAEVDRLSARGRSGVGYLRRYLDERALGRVPAASQLEARMARLLCRFSLPPAVFQYLVYEGTRFVARVDFAYPDRKIVIEVDGWASHSSPSALQRDLDRQNDLVLLGWTVLRFTWHDVVRRPAWVAAQIRSVLGTRGSTPRS